MPLFDRSDMEPIERRVWGALAAVSALLFVAAAWMIHDARQSVPVVLPQAQAPRVVPSAAPASAVAVLPAPVLGEASPASLAAKALASGQELLEICGGAPVLLDPRSSATRRLKVIDEAMHRIAPRPWDAMQRSKDEVIQAAGYAMVENRPALVQLAMHAKDPVVHAMAQASCNTMAVNTSGASDEARWCGGLVASRRAALEPDNGAAWLAVLAEGRRNRDEAMIDEALQQIARAKRFDEHEMAHVYALERHLAATGSSAKTPGTASPWVQVAAAAPSIQFLTLGFTHVCSGNEAVSATRKAACADAAVVMAERSQHPWQRQWGARVAHSLNLPGQDWAERQQLAEAVVMVAMSDRESSSQPYRCADLQQLSLDLAGQRGEGAWNYFHRRALERQGSNEAIIAEAARLKAEGTRSASTASAASPPAR